jgi:hypothetical protein
MKSITLLYVSAAIACALMVSAADAADAASAAPVVAPETDAAVSNSGKVVPGQPIRPESNEEASVPKTPKDKEAASSADVGSEKTNVKSNRASSGADTTNTRKAPAPKS